MLTLSPGLEGSPAIYEKTIWRSYDDRTTVAGSAFYELYQTFNSGLNLGHALMDEEFSPLLWA
ncbi:MAG: hypothetical protein IKX20_02790 [Paludibacteraceae bacterium]|nr:hypothetical protein [Paludibacteraceae bacterium]